MENSSFRACCGRPWNRFSAQRRLAQNGGGRRRLVRAWWSHQAPTQSSVSAQYCAVGGLHPATRHERIFRLVARGFLRRDWRKLSEHPARMASAESAAPGSVQTALQRLDIAIAAWNIVALGCHAQVTQPFQRAKQDLKRRPAGGDVRKARDRQRLRRHFDEALHELVVVLQRRLAVCLAHFEKHARISLIPGLHL